MITVRYCDWSKKVINGDEIFEIKLINGVETHSFELSPESYQHLLALLTNKAQPIVPKPNMVISSPEPSVVEPVRTPEPARQLTEKEMVAEQVISESRVAEVASLPALSDPSKKRETLRKLEEFNRKHMAQFKTKNGGNGINFQDLSESEITNKSRGQ